MLLILGHPLCYNKQVKLNIYIIITPICKVVAPIPIPLEHHKARKNNSCALVFSTAVLDLVDLGGLDDGVVPGDLLLGQAVVVEVALVLVAVAVEGAEDTAAAAGEERQPHLLPASQAPGLLGQEPTGLLLLYHSLTLILQFEFRIHLLCRCLQLQFKHLGVEPLDNKLGVTCETGAFGAPPHTRSEVAGAGAGAIVVGAGD